MQTSPQTTTSLEVRIFETAKNIIDAVKQDPRDLIVLEISGFASNPAYRGRETRDPSYKARSRVQSIVEEVVGPTAWSSDKYIEIRPTIKRSVSLPVHKIPAWPKEEVSDQPPRAQSASRFQQVKPSKGFIPVHRHTPRR